MAQYFDLITGTSTGGIIALGLAAGLKATELRDLYVERGSEIFPLISNNPISRMKRLSRIFKFRYNREALMRVLSDTFGDRKFGEAKTRLCIPSFDGLHGEVHIFKTPHHPDFRKDTKERMTKVAAATSAAPTFFRPLEDGGYKFVDGGVWANNPIMIALVDALSCFSIPRKRISILSLGCGDDGYTVGRLKMLLGGILAWHDIFSAAMRFQSLNALGQAGLLIGADRIVRVIPTLKKKIELGRLDSLSSRVTRGRRRGTRQNWRNSGVCIFRKTC